MFSELFSIISSEVNVLLMSAWNVHISKYSLDHFYHT